MIRKVAFLIFVGLARAKSNVVLLFDQYTPSKASSKLWNAWLQDAQDTVSHLPIVSCSAKNPSDCLFQLLNTSLQTWQDGTYFIALPADSVPLKRFSHILREIDADPRTRLQVISNNFTGQGFPQVSRWMALSRPHAELLLNAWPAWRSEGAWLPGVVTPTQKSRGTQLPPYASDYELLISKVLYERLGPATSVEINVRPHSGVSDSVELYRLPLNTLSNDLSYGWMYECINPMQCINATRLGTPPFDLAEVSCTFPEQLIKSRFWWGRKFSETARVRSCIIDASYPAADYEVTAPLDFKLWNLLFGNAPLDVGSVFRSYGRRSAPAQPSMPWREADGWRHGLVPVSQVTQLAKRRMKLLGRESERSGRSSPARPPKVALLFLTADTLETGNVWHDWLVDAFVYLAKTGLETELVDASNSSYLRTYVHHHPAVDPNFVRTQVPPLMKSTIVSNPAPCYWSNINSCAWRLYEAVLADWEDVDVGLLISHNSIPTKTFRFMYEEIWRDRRSRVRYFDMCYAPDGTPKASNWRLLSAEHMKVLVRRKGDWLYEAGPHEHMEWETNWYNRDWAAADEVRWLRALYSEYGEDLWKETVVADEVAEEVDVASDYWSFDCWTSSKCPGWKISRSKPYLMKYPECRWLTSLFNDPRIWFARKFSTNTHVVGCHWNWIAKPIRKFVRDQLDLRGLEDLTFESAFVGSRGRWPVSLFGHWDYVAPPPFPDLRDKPSQRSNMTFVIEHLRLAKYQHLAL